LVSRVRRVFNLGACADLIPDWLNTVKGVARLKDLPPHISREALQQSKIVWVFKRTLVVKCLDMFAEAADKQAGADMWAVDHLPGSGTRGGQRCAFRTVERPPFVRGRGLAVCRAHRRMVPSPRAVRGWCAVRTCTHMFMCSRVSAVNPSRRGRRKRKLPSLKERVPW